MKSLRRVYDFQPVADLSACGETRLVRAIQTEDRAILSWSSRPAMAHLSIDESLAQMNAMTDRLAQLRKEKRSLARQTSREKDCHWYQKLQLKSLLAQADGNIHFALKFMSNKGYHTFGCSKETEWEAILAKWWSDMTDAEKVKLTTTPVTSMEKSAVSSTKKFMLELDVFTWVQKQNEEHKIAPSSQAIVLKSQEDEECPVAHVIRQTKFNKTTYQTLRRYRRRWDVSNTNIVPKEALPARAKTRKASMKRPHFSTSCQFGWYSLSALPKFETIFT